MKKTEGVSVCLFSVAGVHLQQKHYMLLFALIIPSWLRGLSTRGDWVPAQNGVVVIPRIPDM